MLKELLNILLLGIGLGLITLVIILIFKEENNGNKLNSLKYKK